MNSTSLGAAMQTTSFLFKPLTNLRSFGRETVAGVARSKIFPLGYFFTAGFKAGSSPMIGNLYLRRKISAAADVAVLHAMTIALHRKSVRKSML